MVAGGDRLRRIPLARAPDEQHDHRVGRLERGKVGRGEQWAIPPRGPRPSAQQENGEGPTPSARSTREVRRPKRRQTGRPFPTTIVAARPHQGQATNRLTTRSPIGNQTTAWRFSERRRPEEFDSARVLFRRRLDACDVERVGRVVGRGLAGAAVERLADPGGLQREQPASSETTRKACGTPFGVNVMPPAPTRTLGRRCGRGSRLRGRRRSRRLRGVDAAGWSCPAP